MARKWGKEMQQEQRNVGASLGEADLRGGVQREVSSFPM